MATETPKAKRERKPRRNFQKIVESTTLFCEISIQTCEEFKVSEGASATGIAVFDAQIRAYKRVLTMLSGEAK